MPRFAGACVDTRPLPRLSPISRPAGSSPRPAPSRSSPTSCYLANAGHA